MLSNSPRKRGTRELGMFKVRLHSQDWAETTVAVVRVTVVTIGTEYSGTRAIPPITTA